MANIRVGLSYYSVDTDRYLDIRIRRLKRSLGYKGIVIFDYLICEIYRNGYYIRLDNAVKYSIACYFQDVPFCFISQVVKEAINWGLFDDTLFYSYNILTSREIQINWAKLSENIPADFMDSPYNLIKDVRIPLYKRSDRVRMHQHDVKKWYRIMKEVFRRDNYTCQYCGAKGGKLEADHIIPFSRGGTDDLSNLVTSCRRCNRQKKDKTPEEFLRWKGQRK